MHLSLVIVDALRRSDGYRCMNWSAMKLFAMLSTVLLFFDVLTESLSFFYLITIRLSGMMMWRNWSIVATHCFLHRSKSTLMSFSSICIQFWGSPFSFFLNWSEKARCKLELAVFLNTCLNCDTVKTLSCFSSSYSEVKRSPPFIPKPFRRTICICSLYSVIDLEYWSRKL